VDTSTKEEAVKGSEIQRGQRVAITDESRTHPRVIGWGIVIEPNVPRRVGSYNSRVDASIVRRFEKDFTTPLMRQEYKSGEGYVATDEHLTQTIQNRYIISEADALERTRVAEEKLREQQRRAGMVDQVTEAISTILERAGIEREAFAVTARFVEATDDEPEGVSVNRVAFNKDGVVQLTNFINRELPLMDEPVEP
jgi:hypothetical protein